MSVPAQQDSGSAWPSKGSYRPAGVTPDPAPPGFPPQADQFPPQADLFPPSPDQFPPSPDLFPPSPGRPDGPPRPRRPAGPPPRRPLLLGLGVLLAAGVVAAIVAFLVLRPSHAPQPSAATTPITTPTTTPSAANPGTAQSSPSASSAAPVSEQQAATNLSGLLAQSGKDRNAIQAAVNDVDQCGPTLSQDPQTFQNAASSRQQLLSHLASLPGRPTLPAAMLQELTSAWQASATADADLGQWAQDEVTQGCTQNDQADAHFQAAGGPDTQATTGKKAFVAQWNPIASQYGLTAYQWNQL